MTNRLPLPDSTRCSGASSWRVRRCALGLVSIACLSTSASSVVGTRAAKPGIRSEDAAADTCAMPSTLHLCLVNHAGGPDESFVVARREADAIWADADLSLIWKARGAAIDAADGPTVTVIVRDALPHRPSSAVPPGRPFGPALAWLLFVGNDPTEVMEVSLSAVAAVVMPEMVAGKRIVDLPQTWRRRLLGRALGRVIAHEIGHWVWGAAHERTGLMRADLSGSALIQARAPALPRASIGAAARQRLARDAAGAMPASPTDGSGASR